VLSVDWANLSRFVVHLRRRVALIVATSVIGSLSEAAVLVLVVRLGLLLAGSSGSSVSLPLVGFEPSVAVMVIVGVVLALVNIVVHYVNARRLASLAVDVVVHTRQLMTDAFLAASWSRQATERESALHDTITVQATNVSQLAMHAVSGLVAQIQIVILLALAVVFDPVSSLVVVAVGGVLFGALRPMIRSLGRRARTVIDATAELATDVERVAGMAMEVRAFGVAAEAKAALDHKIVAVGRRAKALRTIGRLSDNLYRDLAVLFIVVVLGLLDWVGPSNVTGIGAVMLLVIRAANAGQSLHVVRHQIGEFGPSLEVFMERLDSLEAAREPLGTRRLDRLGTLEVRGVSYSYGGEEIVRDVSFEVRPGEVVGLVGPSGGGKSTLVQLITRLRHPAAGEIVVGGVPYCEIAANDWTRLVALVPQEPHLMDGSVRDNIRFLRPNISDTDVELAARRAHIWDELQQFPDGVDTVLGHRGLGLSGGQRQRVAIARALVGSPSLLVLDEPTSALDASSEQRLLETLMDLKGSVSVVIVTHRPVPLSACDRVLEMRDGAIVL
jgi:ABC-type multidrug transport system fused ATPase/permease subunit